MLNVAENDTNKQKLSDSELLIMSSPQHGLASVVNNTVVGYAPNDATFGGIDTFSYAYRNTAGTSNTSEVTVYVLNAKQDNYTMKANGDKKQTFCTSAKNGVANNDLPKEGITYTFDSNIILPNSNNQITAIVNGQTNGAFCFTMTVSKSISEKRRIVAKRGTYQVNYNMNLDGVSAPGQAFISVQ